MAVGRRGDGCVYLHVVGPKPSWARKPWVQISLNFSKTEMATMK